MGILFALLAMLSWGLGDFLIQKSARRFGGGVALFYITAAAAVFLFPFVLDDLATLHLQSLGFLVLMLASIVILFAALFDFEALRVGKISVIEPVYAFEVPITVALSVFVLREHLAMQQVGLIIAVMVGILLVTTRSFAGIRGMRLEKGVFLAVLATAGMGMANFLFGVGARETSPLLINWFTSTFIAVAMLIFLLGTRRGHEIAHHWRRNRRLIVGVSIVDNMAWIAFSYSTLFIPIAIATGVSESYIALAAALGLVFNRERLRRHQIAGLAITITAAVGLAFTT